MSNVFTLPSEQFSESPGNVFGRDRNGLPSDKGPPIYRRKMKFMQVVDIQQNKADNLYTAMQELTHSN